ncbi:MULTISPECIES: GNAT family N-acetyltransferase [unclassified Planococcus (in: firmicutes)]|uniref:GNAT family N-acetyltransferase n=1 Tax=unclassified Planococcus (in: firmicutes) TaxID=2662419 RepID=UPI0020B25FEC|nr:MULTISPECIES: GNAT family N-acetyltransferase [unclassified Planococcus (in: firmicutes)]
MHLLQEEDANELFRFESDSRKFFERLVPSRGDDFYVFENFLSRHEELLKEQEEDFANFYLIKNDTGDILGRINLVDIDRINRTAEIGFRIGTKYGGQGIGSRALEILLDTDLRLRQIHGKTTTVNGASQKILTKNGFQEVRVGAETFEMNGQDMSFVYYLWESRTK